MSKCRWKKHYEEVALTSHPHYKHSGYVIECGCMLVDVDEAKTGVCPYCGREIEVEVDGE